MVWNSYRQHTEETARAHLAAAQRMAEEAQAFGADAGGGERRGMEDSVRQWQQRLKLDHKRAMEAKAVYEKRCKEEIVCNHFYHQEMAKFGKLSKEAEKVDKYHLYCFCN